MAATLVGVAIGLGAYTFQYAQGLSYFSNRPEACANCHVMRDVLDSWQKSPHHLRASCNDCHTPHALVPKYVAKAEHGWRHSVGFTLQNFPEPIRITPHDRILVIENCVRCHGEMISEIEGRPGAHDAVALDCLRCHAGVGHGPRR